MHDVDTYCMKRVVVNRGQIQRKKWCMEPYAGVDYNLTLCPLQGRLKYIYHGQPYARVDFIPQSGTLDLASDMGASETVYPTTESASILYQ